MRAMEYYPEDIARIYNDKKFGSDRHSGTIVGYDARKRRYMVYVEYRTKDRFGVWKDRAETILKKETDLRIIYSGRKRRNKSFQGLPGTFDTAVRGVSKGASNIQWSGWYGGSTYNCNGCVFDEACGEAFKERHGIKCSRNNSVTDEEGNGMFLPRAVRWVDHDPEEGMPPSAREKAMREYHEYILEKNFWKKKMVAIVRLLRGKKRKGKGQ